ncbi:MAG: alpha/beta hydrolase [Pirellulales bacterium]
MNDEPGELSRAASPPPVAPTGRRRLGSIVRLALVGVVGYLLVLLLMLAMENSLIYFPSIYPDGYWNPPGLKFEDAWFDAPDGTKLHGWYVPHENPRAVVLFAHGNAGNLSHRADLLKSLHKLGVVVMIFDYRGYGRSGGSPTEAGILADARAARRWLAERAGVKESDIVLMGESLGGGVMVDLAAKDGARALVLENTFTSLADVASYHYPWLPVKLLMRTRLDSAAKIADYHGPLLKAHGEADTIIPFEIGQRLYRAANEPKQLVVIADGDHNDPRSPEFFAALDRFLARLE